MKLPIVYMQMIVLVVPFILGGCVHQEEMDFMASSQGGPSIIHIDKAGYAEAKPIDFLKEAAFGRISARNLDEIAIMENDLSIKYYKNKAQPRSYNVDVKIPPTWLYLVPERNCLLVDFGSVEDNRTIRIDLSTGDQKISLSRASLKNGFSAELSNPLWDNTASNLIVCCTYWPKQAVIDDSNTSTFELARMNPDDMTIANSLPIKGDIPRKNMTVFKLLDFDSSRNNLLVICRPGDGGSGRYVAGVGIVLEWVRPGYYQINTSTGDSTFITDLHDGDNDYDGSAVVAHRYIFSGTCSDGTPFVPGRVFCYDMKNNFLDTWTSFPPKNNVRQVEPYFERAISQDTLQLEGQ